MMEAEKIQREIHLGLAKTYTEANENVEKDAERNKVLERIEATYGKGFDRANMYLCLVRLEEVFGSLQNVRDKRILDLGCGSVMPQKASVLANRLLALRRKGESKSSKAERIRAELLRMRSRYGNVFSYDMLVNAFDPLSKEQIRRFEPWYSRLFLELGAKPIGVDIGNLEGEKFEHHSIDLAKEGSLNFIPDSSMDAVYVRLFFDSPQLEKITGEIENRAVIEEITQQIKRVLKPGGKIIRLGEAAQRISGLREA